MKTKTLTAIELAVWAVWLGGLWIMALLVAPALFKWLPRSEAGLVAGRLFLIFGWLSLGTPFVLWLLNGLSVFEQSGKMKLVLLGIVALAAAGLFVLQPEMNHMRELMQVAGGDELLALKSQFGRLHGVSSVMFALQMMMGLWWGWRRFAWGVQPNQAQL